MKKELMKLELVRDDGKYRMTLRVDPRIAELFMPENAEGARESDTIRDAETGRCVRYHRLDVRVEGVIEDLRNMSLPYFGTTFAARLITREHINVWPLRIAGVANGVSFYLAFAHQRDLYCEEELVDYVTKLRSFVKAVYDLKIKGAGR
jgi:hypothetical protein